MDNASLARTFVDCAIAGKPVLLANSEFRIEPVGKTLQLWAKFEGMVASANLSADILFIVVKNASRHTALLQKTLLEAHLLPAQQALSNGFSQYELVNIPRGYQVKQSDGLGFLQDWWHFRQKQSQANLLGILLWSKKTWHPIRSVECDRGMLQVHTWVNQLALAPADPVVWLLKIEIEKEASDYSSSLTLAASRAPQNQNTLNQTLAGELVSERLPQSSSIQSPSKYIGNYLVEAGLLSTAQVDVVLCDQTTTSMRFGEIVASRGWLKEQTIEYLMKYLIAPSQDVKRTVDSTVIHRDRSVETPHSLPSQSSGQNAGQKVGQKVGQKTEHPIEAAMSDSVHDRETLMIPRPWDEDLF